MQGSLFINKEQLSPFYENLHERRTTSSINTKKYQNSNEDHATFLMTPSYFKTATEVKN